MKNLSPDPSPEEGGEEDIESSTQASDKDI